jgi:hypothetical protein
MTRHHAALSMCLITLNFKLTLFGVLRQGAYLLHSVQSSADTCGSLFFVLLTQALKATGLQ